MVIRYRFTNKLSVRKNICKRILYKIQHALHCKLHINCNILWAIILYYTTRTQMTPVDYSLEKHFNAVASRPRNKDEDTITTFDRTIFWYDRDDVARQTVPNAKKLTYEDHRKVVETAVNMMQKTTVHDIAMCILTHRYFTDYRASAFGGKGSFNTDYGFLVRKIAMLFNHTTDRVSPSTIHSRLREFTTPTLVQINHIAGIVTEMKAPSAKLTLNEWAVKFNENANESSTYAIAGLRLGIAA